MKFSFNTITLVLLLLPLTTFAQIQPAGIFKDHLVLQRDMPVPVWGMAGAGENVTVKLNGRAQTAKADNDGKWIVKLPAMKAGGPYQLEIKGKNTIVYKDIYIGEVWLCSGQSNMDMTVAREDRNWCGVYREKEEVAAANYPLIRLYDVAFNPGDSPQRDVQGEWEICSPETVGHFSATAYFFARELYEKYKIPVGLITTAYGASTAEAWMSSPAIQGHPQLAYLLEHYEKKCAAYDRDEEAQQNYKTAYEDWKTATAEAIEEGKNKPREPKNPDPRKDQHSPCVLYNGMIAPLVPYAIRGAIWYQGESNGATASLYATLMETLIQDWRKAWAQGNFPFLYVQLANHKALSTAPVSDDPMVFVREGQLKNLSIPNTGMAVAIDNADPDNPDNIHPKNKQAIGKRLALIAQAKVYGNRITYSGPVYTKMVIEGKAIRLYFKHTGKGLKAAGNVLDGFAIAGADKKFVWANAKIDGSTIIVSSPQVSQPVAVRYAWAKNPPVSLYNTEGLPASPFRTDVESALIVNR